MLYEVITNPSLLVAENGDQIVMGRNMQIAIVDEHGTERVSYKLRITSYNVCYTKLLRSSRS